MAVLNKHALRLLFCASLVSMTAQAVELSSEKLDFNVEVVVDGLDHPWGMAFLPDGDLLITERSGQLRRVHDGKLLEENISGVPEVVAIGQGGLLGITLDPDFANNKLVYLAYSGGSNRENSTEVIRGALEGTALKNPQVIFRAMPKQSGGYHFGSRLQFDTDGTLFITLGERGVSPAEGRNHPAQQLDSHHGSVIRINADGTVPADKPFVNQPGARPEIFDYGHRNMQGLARHPHTGAIWTHEHGPQGGDEINIERAGINYGWPVITYGANYVTGTRIGEGTALPGMQQPIYKWVPSIAPSGMLFYTGDQFPAWKDNLFVGSLKFGLLVRLELDGEQVVHEERLLNNRFGRIRDVVQGPDGNIYLLTDDSDGKLLLLSPIPSDE